jgi:hypothetical protein
MSQSETFQNKIVLNIKMVKKQLFEMENGNNAILERK